jgi:bifunctional ADP-heptose synthase (sugar kinase/adenylyltransferase)
MLEKIIEEFKSLKVAIIGETITDEFISVHYQGQSMKSFCPVFELVDHEIQRQMGGASAIARHLEGFVAKVEVFSNKPSDIIKTRYIDVDSGMKHLELNRFNPNNFQNVSIDTKDYDVVIVADFGHGFCNNVEINDGFHLMCQTNSHNFGFNRLSKWKSKRKKSVCIDLREASLQINQRINACTDELLAELYNYELNTEDLFVTLGKKGSVYSNGEVVDRHPSFPTQIVDTIGAGDAFFGFAALCSALDLDSKLYIPSLAASLSTTWLCNEKAVNPINLEEHADKYL